MASPSRSSRLLVIVLLSGTGLLAVGLVSLWSAARDAARTARLEAGRAATIRARAIREALRRREIVDRAPPARRFAIEDGGLVVPAWLEVAEAAEPTGSDFVFDLHRDEAETLEFASSNPAGAVAYLRSAVAAEGLDPTTAARLRLLAAWCAHRAGNTATRDSLLAEVPAGERGPASAAVAESFALLCARVVGEAPAWTAGLVARLAEDRARALISRLADVIPSESVAPLRIALRDAAAQRLVVGAARERLDRLAAAREPIVEIAGDALLIYVPEAAGRGRGVLLPPRDAVAMIGEGEAEDLVLGSDQPVSAVPAGPWIGVVPRGAAEGPGWARPGVVAGLLVLLGGTFGIGLVLTVRATRRETLAARARADFLTSVTHELKTPLASIRLLAEMLEEVRVPSEERRDDYHRLLSGEAARLSMLIENVLDLGRIERRERSYDRRPHALDEIVAETARLFTPVADRDGLDLVTAPAAPEATAKIDRGAAVQALLNLVDNARKYALAGGRVEIGTRRVGDAWEATVRDFGPGIEESERERVFSRFERGAAQRDGRVPGVGLGRLYLARRILRDLGGDLTLRAPGDDRGGACFVISIPLATGEIT